MHSAIGGLRLAAFRQQPTSTSSSSPVEPSLVFQRYMLWQPWINNRDYDPNWRHARGDISGIMDGSIA
jgi:hypothetical protein